LENAAKYANESKGLVTIGITPTRPETGYGYIQINDKEVAENIYPVYTFAEKPNYATAVRFVESGDFLWNSGMFIWRADVILDEIKNLMPDLSEGLSTIEKSLTSPNFSQRDGLPKEELKAVYAQLKKISIDYGIMEKSKKVFLTKGSFNWSDVGSWEEVYQLSEKNEKGNAEIGKVYTNMVSDSYIYSPDKVTAVIGLDSVIVINHHDTVLICRRDKAQDVKEIVDYLKMNKMDEYL